jgi:inner membrane protein
MDSITHILLGGALAQAIAGRRAGFIAAFLLGGLAATAPDFDVFIRTGNVVRDHAIHRHFMHSIVMAPVLATVTWAIFMLLRRLRPSAGLLYLAAMAACISHTMLDALTSFGTVMFWPWTERRIALDVIAVIDPLYTLPLMAGVAAAFWKRSVRAAAAGLVLSTCYMGIAAVQHERAARVQQQLLASRGVTRTSQHRVLPQIGGIVLYRSIYIHDGRIFVDAIRPGVFGAGKVKPGGSLPVLAVDDLDPSPLPANIARDFGLFTWFCDGYVARSPDDPQLITDLRYALAPEEVRSVWGVKLETVDRPQWIMRVRWGYTRKLVTDIFRPTGYVAIAQRGVAP